MKNDAKLIINFIFLSAIEIFCVQPIRNWFILKLKFAKLRGQRYYTHHQNRYRSGVAARNIALLFTVFKYFL